MLQRTLCFLHMVTSSSLSYASGELNKLLDVKHRKAPVRHDELRRFLSQNVTPVLEGTSLDRRSDSKAMKRMLGQLVRDSAFAANVLHANPEKAFVRTLVDCIVNDTARMRFLPHLSSTQASKTIEYLCKVGVRDPAVYPPLVSKLDFHNLKEIARVTFAFAEAQLDVQNITLVVPLYCGETWALAYEVPHGAPSRSENSACNVFEAVRVLRALSKSTRALVESERQRKATTPIPYESVGQLRDQLLLFLFANENVMRGAHWVNTARALVHFPSEAQTINDRLLNAAEGNPLLQQIKEAIGARPPQRGVATVTTCDDVALLCMQKVFDYAEGRRCDGLATAAGSSAERAPSDLRGTGSAEPPAVFDLTQLDLVKLVPLLRQVPCTEEVRRRRFDLVFNTISSNLTQMQFGGLVQLIHTLRQLEGSEAFTSEALQRIAIEAGSRLSAAPPDEVVAEVPMTRIVQFAAQLHAFQVRQCPGFIEFMEKGSQYLPPAMNPEMAATLLNALTTVMGKGGVAVNPEIKTAVLRIANSVVKYSERGRAQQRGSRRDVEDTLLFRHPQSAVKILRAMVLLDVLPTADLIYATFGVHGDAQWSSQMLPSGAALPFDLSRSLMHFCRQSRATATAPPRLQEDRVDKDQSSPLIQSVERNRSSQAPPFSVEELLWTRGVRHTLLPLLVEHTEELAATYVGSTTTNLPPSSYAAVCWRSTMECAAMYVDVTMDVNKSFDHMAERFFSIYRHARDVAQPMLGIMATQCVTLRALSHNPQELHHLFSTLPFSSNAAIHAISFMLVWEYLVYQAAWEANRLLTSRAGEALSERTRQLAEQVRDLKANYNAFLAAPLGRFARTDLQTCTPLDVLSLVFSAAACTPAAATAFPAVVGEPLLQKSHVLEITTHLPFAISLVLEPGPVNELFSQHSVPLLLASDE